MPNGKKFTFSGESENIVGKIPGKDSTKSVVISAHFDTWPTVAGVLDNTSGTAALMSLSKKLKEHYKDEQPPIDIVFVAFNGEEHQLSGSKAFYPMLDKDYKDFYNINLDCIGQKDRSLSYKIDDKNSQQLAKDIKQYLLKENVKLNDSKYDEQGTSDHAIFWGYGRAAMIIGNDIEEDFVHTEKDNDALLDYEEIQKIVDGLNNFIIENNGKMY
ncbi:MAG: Zn-dependent exopeptidase M28 [Enterococcus lacertideformus]|uniref:Zn-dependent exopeptidase M28 n=1 Tax=Enterococcus lacertideformus TaxID=2771493 RepID=A0A931AVI2_9ENTE|nr:Zn-dependent exopeptidase M28 [Enterococcus lacertideformus]